MRPIPRRPLIYIITDLLEYSAAANDTINYTKKKVAKYGDVCDVSFTGIRNFFIQDPDVIKEVLTTQSPKFKRSRLFRAFRKFLGLGLFTNDGDYHRQQRRLIKPAFLPARIEEYAAVMVQCAQDEIATWQRGQELNVNKSMVNITLQVITKTLFGTGLEQGVVDRVGRLIPESFDVMNRIVQNPFYVYCLEHDIKIPVVKRLHTIKDELVTIISRIIATYRRDTGTKRTDLLTLLLDARDEDTGKGMTDEQVLDEVMTFFIAGHETTSLALTWTLYLLGKHPEVAEEFYAEVKSVIGDRTATAADYPLLPLTRNIFRESLRLYPPAWTFARENTEDVVIKDYFFPKGSVLWTITYLVHRDERFFHHPDEFIPGRWNEAQMRDLPRYAYFPFGGGPRMCIGEGFAWMEGVLVLATIASKFRLTLPEGFSTTVNPVFSLKTKDDVRMVVG